MSTERNASVLVIDDNELLCKQIAAYFQSRDIDTYLAHTGKDGLAVCEERSVDVVLLDQQLPDGEGWSFCSSILRQTDDAKVIFITAYPSFENALKALRLGADDYLAKPFEFQELEIVIKRALKTKELERLAKLQTYSADKEREATVLVGKDQGLEEVNKLVTLAASATAPVLITGETGTGKNLVAAAIHHLSAVRTAGFVSINCSTLPEHLFEAELFGYEKGAFTGALSSKRGLFEVAEGGTLFLDEIGSIPFGLQSKLLSALEERRIRRIGGVSFRPVDVRIMAATNMDIETAVRENSFREDLYYRLNVIRLHIPPLRSHMQDLPALCMHFINQILPRGHISIGDDELKRLEAYRWPGNVRELRNVIERAILLRDGPNIQPSHFIGLSSEPFVETSAGEEQQKPIPGESEVIPLAEMERRLIAAALRKEGGNFTRAAKTLGISLSTLKRKVKGYGLSRDGSF